MGDTGTPKLYAWSGPAVALLVHRHAQTDTMRLEGWRSDVRVFHVRHIWSGRRLQDGTAGSLACYKLYFSTPVII